MLQGNALIPENKMQKGLSNLKKKKKKNLILLLAYAIDRLHKISPTRGFPEDLQI